MSRQTAADYFGVTVQEASVRQWKALNMAGVNPRNAMDADHFIMAYDAMYMRVARMLDVMMDVYPDMERRLLAFVEYYELPSTWQTLVVNYVFKMLNNLVWPLIRAEDGLTQLKIWSEKWMEKIASQRDGWMFN